jgi:hypothetical protein
MLEALCRSSGTTLDIRMSRDGPPITQRTSGLKIGDGAADAQGGGDAADENCRDWRLDRWTGFE